VKQMKLRSKILILVASAGMVTAAVMGYRALTATGCPGASKRWAYRAYPSTASTESELINFVEEGPSYGEIEEWSRSKNCSGDGELVGRVFAAAVDAKSQDVLLGYMYIAVVDSNEGSSPDAAAAEFERLFSSAYARRVFDPKVVDSYALKIRSGNPSFSQALLQILSGPLGPETRKAFQREVRSNRLVKGKS
jgi:hypothetical protein